MSAAYFDTSAIMRLLVRARRGHQTAREVWSDADDVVSIRLTYVETRAALAAARRNSLLTGPAFERAKSGWQQLWAELTIVDVTRFLAADAGDLAEQEALGGYDAVHLAAALATGCDVLVCADRRLCAAGQRQGIAVLDLDAVQGRGAARRATQASSLHSDV